MIFNKCIFLLVVTVLLHDSLVDSHTANEKRFGIFDISSGKLYGKEAITPLFNQFMEEIKMRKLSELNEAIRQKTSQERPLNSVVFRHFIG